MSGLFLLFVLTALVLWIYGLIPFLRVRAYLAKNRPDPLLPFASFRTMFNDKQHPAHEDFRKVAYAYGGFIACVLLGMLIGYFTFPKR